MGFILLIDFRGSHMWHLFQSRVHNIVPWRRRIKFTVRELAIYIDYTMGSCTCFSTLDRLEPFPKKILRIKTVRGEIYPVWLAAFRGFGGLRHDWYVVAYSCTGLHWELCILFYFLLANVLSLPRISLWYYFSALIRSEGALFWIVFTYTGGNGVFNGLNNV